MSLQNSFNKIKRSAGIKKCVMIDGNVGDVYLDEKNKIVTLREFLEAMFKDMDYQDIVYWDRVEGATGAVDKLTLTDEVEVEGDSYDLDDEEEKDIFSAQEKKDGGEVFDETELREEDIPRDTLFNKFVNWFRPTD